MTCPPEFQQFSSAYPVRYRPDRGMTEECGMADLLGELGATWSRWSGAVAGF